MQPSEVTFFLADQVYKKMRSLCFSTEEVNQQNDIVTKLVTFHMVILSLFSILIPGHVARVVREDYLASEAAIGVDFC